MLRQNTTTSPCSLSTLSRLLLRSAQVRRGRLPWMLRLEPAHDRYANSESTLLCFETSVNSSHNQRQSKYCHKPQVLDQANRFTPCHTFGVRSIANPNFSDCVCLGAFETLGAASGAFRRGPGSPNFGSGSRVQTIWATVGFEGPLSPQPLGV